MLTGKHINILAIVLVLCCQNLFSQIIVSGLIHDTDNEPVADALVELIDQADSSRVFSSTTNNQGWYSIQISTTGINDNPAQTPGKFNLLQNYPNPFNPSTVISYEIPHPAHVRIEIYNVLGQKIKTLIDGYQTNLYGQEIWDGTNNQNLGVAAGVYIYSLVTDDCRLNRKMLLLDGHMGNTGVTSSATTSSTQPGLSKAASNLYLLRVSGMDIINKDLYDLQITENMEQAVTVIRAGSMTDIDGNVYKTVQIGDQCWMAENLKVTHYRNGDPIPNVTGNTEWGNLTSGAYCYYDNNTSYAIVYGALYNWYAVNDSCNISPTGWHVPTDEEWQLLEMYLGMSQSEADTIGLRGIDEGGMLKETGTAHWISPNEGATNASGFTGRPGGSRYYSDDGYFSFSGLGGGAFYWSATEHLAFTFFNWYRILFYCYSDVFRSSTDKEDGCSVRLVRDN